MPSKTRRMQQPKPRNYSLAMAMQDKRRGSATGPVPSGTRYNRKKDTKHRNRMFQEA